MDEGFMKEKPVFQLIVTMALPMVLSMLVNSLYNIVDSFFVAKISEDAMTALSLVYPVQNLINAVAIGFGVGINAVISFHLGEGKIEKANTAAACGFLLSAIHGLAAMLVSIAVMPIFLRRFTMDGNVMDLGLRYARIAFSFSVIIMLGLAFEKLFQAAGRMKVTMIGLLCGCIANMILDPLLIFGVGFFPAMGIQGAALATGLGQFCALTFYLIVYKVRPFPVRLEKRYLVWDQGLVGRLYTIGIPAVLNLALPSLLISALNGMLALYSQSYVVVLGIYYKLQTFLYLPANGIVQGMRPLIGYNFGAREYGRVRRIYGITLAMTGAIMAFGTGICLSAAKGLISLFTENPETIAAGQTALRIISAGFLVSAVSVVSSGALEGLGKGKESLTISLCRYVVIMIPAAFLFGQIAGPVGIWNAFWVSETAAAAVAAMVYRKGVGKLPDSSFPEIPAGQSAAPAEEKGKDH